MVRLAKKKKNCRIFFAALFTVICLISVMTSVCAHAETAQPSPTYYDKGDVELFPGDPEGTGNSAGEIAFMLIIVLGCLFFIVEAIVSYIRKKGR